MHCTCSSRMVYRWLIIVGLSAVFCFADEEYEVEDDVAILTAEYRKTQGARSYIIYLFAIAMVAIIGMASVYYVRFTWKERMEVKVQNLQENMTNYAVISRQAHQEEVASLRRRHNKELSDIKDASDKRVLELTNEKTSNESKWLDTKRKLERCQQRLIATETENQRLITINEKVQNKKDLEIRELRAACEEQRTKNLTIHSTASLWEKKAKDLELELETMEQKNTNLQREISELKKKVEAGGFMRKFIPSKNRHPAETTTSFRAQVDRGDEPGYGEVQFQAGIQSDTDS